MEMNETLQISPLIGVPIYRDPTYYNQKYKYISNDQAN